jgi:PIN like domain
VGALTFYFDRCFGKRFPEAIWKARPPFSVEYHHSKKLNFPQAIKDDEWLHIVGPKGWIVFSHDRRFHNEMSSVAAIKQHDIGCFYLWGSNAETWDKLRCFARGYDRIAEIAVRTPKPFIFYMAHNCQMTEVKIP